MSQEVLEFEPERRVILDRPTFLTSFKSAPWGSCPGPGGCTYENLKTLLDESDTTDLLFGACASFAQAKVPEEVASVSDGRLTALSKPDVGSGESQLDVFFDVWWREHSQSSSRPCSEQSCRAHAPGSHRRRSQVENPQR